MKTNETINTGTWLTVTGLAIIVIYLVSHVFRPVTITYNAFDAIRGMCMALGTLLFFIGVFRGK